MDSESLKIFCAVAAELSITQAALALGRVPSNVTTRIQQLESDVGVELFVRTGKRMALSSAGERFLDYARRLLALEEEARHVVTGGVSGGALRIGSMESTAASRLLPVLADYHTKHPNTRVDIITGPTRHLIEQVRTGTIDCAFVAVPLARKESLAESGIQQQLVWPEELVLLLPTSDAGARNAAEIRTRNLAAFALGCTYRHLAEEWLSIAESTDWKINVVGSYHAMVACVAAGSCVTLLPESVLKLTSAPPALRTLHVGHADTYLIWRQGFNVPAFQNLLARLSEER
ncbi:LysR family transcriptional regulator NmoR [Massilia terrae]|uniref:LysR substrate-binding domain-containing protein n=1 Tax=Massilia terrae TaxID=1811224 RepID=A0ABT2D3L4_9BURK|nr:LysR substrate-binding domain-containing protein [Massilia terrae]MCS0660797.1 LysR substrate-binding domain-containing protein [Massilia terrae]